MFRAPTPRRGPRPGPGGPRKQGGARPRLPQLTLPRLGLGEGWRRLRATLAAHPRRAAGFFVLGLALLLFVGMTSLPLALLRVSPRLALLLSPNHPYTQLWAAEAKWRDLIARLKTPSPEPKEDAAVAGAASGSVSSEGDSPAREMAGNSTPDAASDPAKDAAKDPAKDPVAGAQDVTDLLADIQARAVGILHAIPLSSAAYRLIGETAKSPDDAREALRTAFSLSRREPIATLWLLNDAFQRRDFPDVVRKADVLLRNAPELNAYTYKYLQAMPADPEARAALADGLAAMPPWRGGFMALLGASTDTDDGLALFLDLKQRGAPASAAEVTPYLRARLNAAKDTQGSYNLWLQLLSDQELAALLPLNNGRFATDPSGAPFDWILGRSSNVSVRFARLKDDPGGRALRLEFGIGRVRFGGMSQVVFLRPGPYSFKGQQSGTMSAKRGMVWEVRCFKANDALGQSSQLFGAPRGWQDFSFDFTVPERGCLTQTVRLVHDSRSASEEYASGEILFSNIRVEPAAPAEPDSSPPSGAAPR